MVLESLFFKVGIFSFGEYVNMIDDDLEFNRIFERELGLYFVVNDSEILIYL